MTSEASFFNLDAPITKKDEYVCPICVRQCAVGAQCSLCHRWFHTSAPKNATGATNARRDPCVARPFLMPFFCQHCCQVAAAQVRRLSDAEMDDNAYAASMSHGSLIDFMGAQDESLEGSRREAQYDKWVCSVLIQVASADSVTQSQRAEVQAEWTNLFTRSTLKRLRAYLAKNVSARYAAPEMTDASSRLNGPKDRALQLLPVEELDDRTGKPYQTSGGDGGDGGNASEGVMMGNALQMLQMGADAAVVTQRRRWLGEPLEYANVTAVRNRQGSRAVGGASVLAAKSSGAFTMSLSSGAPGQELDLHANLATGYLAGTGIRVSRITVQIEDSDDDTASATQRGGHAPFA